jgi:hypothetical protein
MKLIKETLLIGIAGATGAIFSELFHPLFEKGFNLINFFLIILAIFVVLLVTISVLSLWEYFGLTK